MLTHTDWLVHLERHKDLLREAENERLAKIALSARRARKAEEKAKAQRIKAQKPVCCQAAAA